MLHSFEARTGLNYGEPLPETSSLELDQAIQKSAEAFDGWQASDGEKRASLLNALAEALEADREKLVELADVETGLGRSASMVSSIARHFNCAVSPRLLRVAAHLPSLTIRL